MTRARILLERIRNIPGLGRDVTVVVALALVGTLSAVYMLANQGTQAPWKDSYEFAAVFDKAPGVRPQARQEVRIAGVDIGRITEAETVEGGAKLTMSIDPDQRVYSNARLVLRTKSPLNVMYVSLNPGGPPAEPLPEGATIPIEQTQRAVQPYEILAKLDSRTQMAVTALLNELDVALTKAPARLPDGLNNTHTAMTDFEPVLDALAKRRGHIKSLVGSLSVVTEAVAGDDERLARLATSLQTTLSTVAARDEELSDVMAQLPGFTSELKTAMRGTKRLTDELNPTLDSVVRASKELPPALESLTSTVEKAGDVVDRAVPVVDRARPLIGDLRPFVRHLNDALVDLAPVVGYLPAATERIVPWMDDLAAFTYQTSSAFSLYDVNGGLGRAELQLILTNPTGGLGDVGLEDD